MITPQDIFKKVDELNDSMFKDYVFKSWETGLNSTERKNKARVIKILNSLDKLNRWNVKDDALFYFCSQLIKKVLSKDYDIKETRKDTYKMIKKVKNDFEQ